MVTNTYLQGELPVGILKIRVKYKKIYNGKKLKYKIQQTF